MLRAVSSNPSKLLVFHSLRVYARLPSFRCWANLTIRHQQGCWIACFLKFCRCNYGVAYSQYVRSPSHRTSSHRIYLHALLADCGNRQAGRRIGTGRTAPRLRSVAPGSMETDVRAQFRSSESRAFQLHAFAIAGAGARSRPQPLSQGRETAGSTASK